MIKEPLIASEYEMATIYIVQNYLSKELTMIKYV